MTNEPKLKPKKMTYTRLDYPSELEKARMVGWNNCCDDWEEYLRQKIDVGEIEKALWSAEACIADGLLSGKGVTKEYGQLVIQEIRECRKALAEHFGKGEK